MTAATKPVATAEPVVHTGPIQDAPNEGRALTLVEPAHPAEHHATPALVAFTPAQVEIIKDMYMPGATDDELAVFILICTSRQLNPFTKQIYAIKRKQKRDGKWVEVFTHQTSIDGFRLIAKRTGRYRGQTTPLFCGADGVWTEAWLQIDPPTAAKVGVLHADFDQPQYAVALWREYAAKFDDGNLMGMWAKMPSIMLAKVAEALALRKAFPEELSGLYTDDEMAQANNADRAESRRAATTQNGERAAGSGSTSAEKPADPYAAAFVGVDPAALTLEQAMAVPLVGGVGSWGGAARKPLRDLPEKQLRRAFTWYGDRLTEDDALAEDAPNKMIEENRTKFHIMRAAIPLVLEELAKNQGTLGLEGDSGARVGPFEGAAAAARASSSTITTPSADRDTTEPASPTTSESLEDLHRQLHDLMDHPLMPKESRAFFSTRVSFGKVNTPLAAKLHIAMAKLCYEIGDELVTVVDERVKKEMFGLLISATTYKPETLTKLRDRLRADSPGGY